MNKSCENRVAIVTGAGRGIGREHALMLASEGAKVVVNDLGGDESGRGEDLTPAQEVVNEIVGMGGEAIVNGCNVADFDAAGSMIEEAVDKWGRIDILINNAGILRDRMLFSMSEDDWDAVINVHLKGTFAPTHHASVFWRESVKAGGETFGRVINTSSPSGIYGNVGQTNYGAAKAGIAAFSVIAALLFSLIEAFLILPAHLSSKSVLEKDTTSHLSKIKEKVEKQVNRMKDAYTKLNSKFISNYRKHVWLSLIHI